VDAYVVRLDSLTLGSIVIAGPIAGYSVETERRGDAGTMGVAVLSRFNLTFDYTRRRLILEPTARTHRPMQYDASGLLLTGSGPDLRGIEVLYVEPGSPAAEAGIKPGDALVKVDDKPVSALGLTGVRSRLTQPGPASLDVVSHDQARHVLLQLRQRL
jgi:S1-C subfamily serine protease